MKRNFFRLLLSAVLMMCCTVMANANGTKIQYENGKYMYFILDDANRTATVTWGGSSQYVSTPEYTGSITIPSTVTHNSKQYSVTSIGDGAFYYCTSLASINFSDIPLSYIGNNAFAGCTSLSKAFFFSNTPPTLGAGCFPDNTTVYVKNSKLVTKYSQAYDFKGRIIAYPDNMMLKYQTTDGNAINRGGCLYSSYETGCGIMYFDHVLTDIGKFWFDECGSLFSISLPNTITSIGYGAFCECSNLRTIVIPEKVKYIGEIAFKFCMTLRDVFFLGDNNIGLGRGVFEDAPATIYVADTKNFSQSWDGKPVRSWRSGKGDGTRDNPYEIENYVNLYGFSLEVRQGNTSICGKLTADITANNGVLNEDGTLRTGPFKVWEPIGNWADNYAKGYRGEFDGGGHTISGLYFNDETRSAVGLFGMTNGSTTDFSPTCTDRARIHDVGIKDSYFRGKSHVGGICGDFANGWMQYCWNAATVHAIDGTVGGIVGSGWKYAHITGCYNIGYVSVDSDNKNTCGGICGVVSRSSVGGGFTAEDCVSLEGRCDKAWNADFSGTGGGQAWEVTVKNAAAFASGEVCYILNDQERGTFVSRIGTKWRQQIGKDPLPIWTGNYLVNYEPGINRFYYNETTCEVSDNHTHDFYDSYVQKCDGSCFNYWHCRKCGKYYAYEGTEGYENMTQEFPGKDFIAHPLEFVKAAVIPTATTTGHYDYWHCTHCGKDFLEGDYSNPVTSEQWIVHLNNNEIWYTSTNSEIITPTEPGNFGVKLQTNGYKYGLGKITFDKEITNIGKEAFRGYTIYPNFTVCVNLQTISIPSSVTSIGGEAFKGCRSLQSITIPSSVTSIGGQAFNDCSSLATVTFNSLPVLGTEAFYPCESLDNKILDLTDSDKPFIGNTLNAYHPFTEARYRRTLEKDKLETIVLPFVPKAESIVGLDFYTLTSVTDDIMTFIKVEDIHAGEPYLIKNTSDTKEFTFIAKEPKSITIKSSDQCADGYAMKATFQKATLTNETGKKFYYLNGTKFQSISENQEIDPFRAYIETPNTSAPTQLTIKTQGGSKKMTGDGTQTNPYQINDKDDLDWFVNEVNTNTPNACAVLMEDITYNGEAKLLDADGNINSGSFDGWRPIMGKGGIGYSGEFNGNGHTISGLYVNDENKEKIGLFGKVTSGAHIHNLGVSDSYFCGKSWVAGICGELNGGCIENCWNAATVIAKSGTADFGYAGGIAGSCETDASVISCYNVGKVTSDFYLQYGGICGMVNSTIKDCVTLDVCDAGCKDIRAQANIINMFTKNADAFKSGEVCWLLNGGSSENVKWHQTLGEGGDKYPTLTGTNTVYMTAKKCDGSAKAFSNTKPESVTQDAHNLISHDASVSTCTIQGHIQHRSCTECGHLFKYDSNEELTEDQVYLPLNLDKHNLTLIGGIIAYCEWCEQDFKHFLAQDDKPVLLKGENDSYYLDKVELKYGHSYICTDEVDVNNFSYTFRYHPNVWNSLFVPFEITTDELGVNGLGFTAAYIAGVRQYEKDASGNIITQVDVVKIKNGKLRAGTPYLIKKESTATEPLEATLNKMGATLKESSKVNNIHTETATANYDFIGTYNTIAEEDVKSNYYILGSEGAFVHPSSPVYAMNWYMEITDKGAVYDEAVSLAKTIIINVIGEEDETTGIRTLYPAEKQIKEVYDLSGRRLNAPKKGQINIINGKKILVK